MHSLFSGLTVLDLTKVFSGPLATRYFADHGAKVIKIETEGKSDPSRLFPPLKNNFSGYFEILNRNKQSLNLDLKNQKDYNTFIKLVKTADVVVENMLPNVKIKLKIDYEILKKINPKIIVASLAGIDQNTNTKYYDLIAQAESGLLSLCGTPDNPTKIGPAVIDAFSGSNLAFAISSALYFREKTGKGQKVFISMLASAMNLLEQNMIEYSVTKKNPIRPGNQDTAIAPFGIFKTQNGSIVLAIGDDSIWNSFIKISNKFEKLKKPIFSTNQNRLNNLNHLVQEIEFIFFQYKTKEIIELLQKNNIPSTTIHEMSDVYNNPWMYNSGALKKISHPEMGEIVIPGLFAYFSESQEINYSSAPKIKVK